MQSHLTRQFGERQGFVLQSLATPCQPERRRSRWPLTRGRHAGQQLPQPAINLVVSKLTGQQRREQSPPLQQHGLQLAPTPLPGLRDAQVFLQIKRGRQIDAQHQGTGRAVIVGMHYPGLLHAQRRQRQPLLALRRLFGQGAQQQQRKLVAVMRVRLHTLTGRVPADACGQALAAEDPPPAGCLRCVAPVFACQRNHDVPHAARN
ncbi:hypothetical protein D3C81_1618600 [compost metagenome]